MPSLDLKNPTHEHLFRSNCWSNKKYSNKKIIINVIAPNIPSSWKKYFKLKEEKRRDTIPDVLRILETLEELYSTLQTTQESRKWRNKQNFKPKGNIIPNEKTIGRILSKTRKRGTNQRTLASYFITGIMIGRIVTTIPILTTSKAKREIGSKKRKVRRTEELEKKRRRNFVQYRRIQNDHRYF